jgi:hypothetical protein
LKRLGIATPVKIEKINWNIAVLKRQKHPTFLDVSLVYSSVVFVGFYF